MGSGKVLKLAIKKYGKENFRKEWLMFCEDAEELNYMERVFVDQTWVERSDTYNLAIGGETPRHIHSGMKGRHHTDETKSKLAVAHRGKPSPMKGKHFSLKARKAMSDAHKGLPSGRKGKRLSNEQRAKLSETTKARMTPEMRQRISNSLTGRKKPEHSISMSGRKHYNNGIISIMAYECPEGFVEGCIPFKHKEVK